MKKAMSAAMALLVCSMLSGCCCGLFRGYQSCPTYSAPCSPCGAYNSPIQPAFASYESYGAPVAANPGCSSCQSPYGY